MTASKAKYILPDDDDEEEKPEDIVDRSALSKPKSRVLSSEEVMEALDNCESEDALVTLESGVDIFHHDGMSTWTIDITETAHKWFKRHLKKDRVLCERVIRRLTLLSTGRWPYVLCKPLKAKPVGQHGRKIHLYETKIDAASRIIWEVGLRSYCLDSFLFLRLAFRSRLHFLLAAAHFNRTSASKSFEFGMSFLITIICRGQSTRLLNELRSLTSAARTAPSTPNSTRRRTTKAVRASLSTARPGILPTASPESFL